MLSLTIDLMFKTASKFRIKEQFPFNTYSFIKKHSISSISHLYLVTVCHELQLLAIVPLNSHFDSSETSLTSYLIVFRVNPVSHIPNPPFVIFKPFVTSTKQTTHLIVRYSKIHLKHGLSAVCFR